MPARQTHPRGIHSMKLVICSRRLAGGGTNRPRPPRSLRTPHPPPIFHPSGPPLALGLAPAPRPTPADPSPHRDRLFLRPAGSRLASHAPRARPSPPLHCGKLGSGYSSSAVDETFSSMARGNCSGRNSRSTCRPALSKSYGPIQESPRCTDSNVLHGRS